MPGFRLVATVAVMVLAVSTNALTSVSVDPDLVPRQARSQTNPGGYATPDLAWWRMNSGTTETLLAVWGTAANNVFSAGANGLILHYDGRIWLPMQSGTTESLNGIWGSGPTDIFAVGTHGTILHYDGHRWSSMSSPTTATLNAIWGHSVSDAFSVGDDGVILHFDGERWTEMNSGVFIALKGVWGTSADNVIAVGGLGHILRYSGTNWVTEFTYLAPVVVFYATWGTSDTNVYAVGDLPIFVCCTTIFHNDGTRWVGQGTDFRLHPFYGLWGSRADDIFTVGRDGVTLHFDGGRWIQMDTPSEETLYAVWGNDSTHVFAVGDHGSILQYSAKHDSLPRLWLPIMIR